MPKSFTFPPELQCMILERADVKDLSNLRLTSKFFDWAVRKRFGKCCLSSRRFNLTQKSLEGLVALTAHEYFGQFVETINLGTFVVDGSRGRPHTAAVHAAIEDQHEFLESDGHVNLLAAALQNIKRYCKKISHGIFDDAVTENLEAEVGDSVKSRRQSVYRRSYGYEKSLTHVQHGLLLKSNYECIHNTWLAACNLAEFPFTTLNLDLESVFNYGFARENGPFCEESLAKRLVPVVTRR